MENRKSKGGRDMKKAEGSFVVTYQDTDGNRHTKSVVAYNVFHAEKVAKAAYGPNIQIESIWTKEAE